MPPRLLRRYVPVRDHQTTTTTTTHHLVPKHVLVHIFVSPPRSLSVYVTQRIKFHLHHYQPPAKPHSLYSSRIPPHLLTQASKPAKEEKPKKEEAKPKKEEKKPKKDEKKAEKKPKK